MCTPNPTPRQPPSLHSQLTECCPAAAAAAAVVLWCQHNSGCACAQVCGHDVGSFCLGCSILNWTDEGQQVCMRGASGYARAAAVWSTCMCMPDSQHLGSWDKTTLAMMFSCLKCWIHAHPSMLHI